MTDREARIYAQAAVREVLVGERRRLGLQATTVAELEATVIGRMQRLMETLAPHDIDSRLARSASLDDEAYLRLRAVRPRS